MFFKLGFLTCVRDKKKMKHKSILMGQFLNIFEVAPGVRQENTQKLGLKRVCNSLFHLISNSGF
ncbi:hypothetical protein AYO37_00875 [Opitutia bacterium SCGC AG-212-L18]|nr:hypothetical protein AYO37_00875 [Opitutae bacterium SCGC AG-212-L18]